MLRLIDSKAMSLKKLKFNSDANSQNILHQRSLKINNFRRRISQYRD